MPRELFIERWKRHVAGVLALGTAQFRKVLSGRLDSAADLGGVVCGLEEEATRLLGQLYDSAARDLADDQARPPLAVVPKADANGAAPQQRKGTA